MPFKCDGFESNAESRGTKEVKIKVACGKMIIYCMYLVILNNGYNELDNDVLRCRIIANENFIDARRSQGTLFTLIELSRQSDKVFLTY